MERSEVWTAIDDQRRALVHLLEDLSEKEWRQPSLCEGWTVRQVAAHLALQRHALVSDAPGRARSYPPRRHERRDPREWRAATPNCPSRSLSARSATGSGYGGRCRPLPSARRPSTTWCTARTSPSRSAGPCRCHQPSPSSPRTGCGPASRMFHARKKLAGDRLVADDASWAAGQGHEIAGPISALLLLLTGRPAALPQLSGPAVAGLRRLLAPSAPG